MRLTRNHRESYQIAPNAVRTEVSPCGTFEQDTLTFLVRLHDFTMFPPPGGGGAGWYLCIDGSRKLRHGGAPMEDTRILHGPFPSEDHALARAIEAIATGVQSVDNTDLEVTFRHLSPREADALASGPSAVPAPANPPIAASPLARPPARPLRIEDVIGRPGRPSSPANGSSLLAVASRVA